MVKQPSLLCTGMAILCITQTPQGSAQALSFMKEFHDGYGASGFGRAIAMSGDRMAISADGNGDGSVQVFARDQGGAEMWELLTVVEPHEDQRSGFGRTLLFDGDDLLIGGANGTWEYQWLGGLWNDYQLLWQVDTFPATAISLFEDRLAVATQGPILDFDGIVNLYKRHGPGDRSWQHIDLFADGYNATSQPSCTGSAVILHGDRLLISDTCLSMTQVLISKVLSVPLDPQTHTAPDVGIVASTLSQEAIVGKRYGSALGLSGDTLFIGWNGDGPSATSWVEALYMDNDVVRMDSLRPGGDPELAPNGRTGYSILVEEQGRVLVGAERGIMIHQRNMGAGGWDLVGTVGPTTAPVTALARTGDLVAAAMPEAASGMGAVIMYREAWTGVQDPTACQRIRVQPVPAEETVQIQLPQDMRKAHSFLIQDSAGRDLRHEPAGDPGTLTIQRQGMAAGCYLLTIMAADGRRMATTRLVWR